MGIELEKGKSFSLFKPSQLLRPTLMAIIRARLALTFILALLTVQCGGLVFRPPVPTRYRFEAALAKKDPSDQPVDDTYDASKDDNALTNNALTKDEIGDELASIMMSVDSEGTLRCRMPVDLYL